MGGKTACFSWQMKARILALGLQGLGLSLEAA